MSEDTKNIQAEENQKPEENQNQEQNQESQEKNQESQEQEVKNDNQQDASNDSDSADAKDSKEENKDSSSGDSSEDSSDSEDVEVPEKFAPIVEAIESLTVLELNELVKIFEKKFGVSATAVAVAGASGGDSASEEKTEFTVELVSDGGSKIPVMKAVKSLLGLGLKEAKELVENLPSVLKEGVNKEDAEKIKSEIESAGGKVEIK